MVRSPGRRPQQESQVTRIAILTDIHGNREAFAAVLAQVEARQAGQIAILGDLVGYGPDPGWCTDKVRELAGRGALVVRGNHDTAIARSDGAMSTNARLAIAWTRSRLDDAQKTFLAGLPLQRHEGDLFYCHASADHPQDWGYISSAERAAPSFRATTARVLFCGHTHVPLLCSQDISAQIQQHYLSPGVAVPLLRTRRWLAVVGSVGQPRDGVPEAGWAMFDDRRNELTFYRTPYDVAATVTKLRDGGLPEALALRLLTGQ